MIRAQVLREVIRSSYNAKNDPYLRFSMKHITILIIELVPIVRCFFLELL